MLQEAEHGLTAMAMSNGRYQNDDNLLVRFFMHPKLNQTRSAEEGRPIYEELPYIQIMVPGNKDSIIQRPASDMDKTRFAEHYRKFEARIDQDTVEGTLLEEWPGITRSQAEELKYFNIRTVEQLAGVSDSNAQNIMGIQFLKQKATAYLEASKEEATAEALAEMTARLEALEARNQELEAELETVEEEVSED
jgi:hypothetical protein